MRMRYDSKNPMLYSPTVSDMPQHTTRETKQPIMNSHFLVV